MGHEIEPTLNTCRFHFFAAFRNLSGNDLTELPPGIFDSLALVAELYVLSLVMEASFVSYPPPA